VAVDIRSAALLARPSRRAYLPSPGRNDTRIRLYQPGATLTRVIALRYNRVLPFLTGVARFQQFEVWQINEGRWELVSSFAEFDVAYAVAKNRKSRVRLLKVSYENGTPVEQEVIAEVGETRGQP
jgi:hypothetical protein